MNFLAYVIFLSILASCGKKSTTVNQNKLVEKSVITLSELSVLNTSTGINGLVEQQLGNLEQGVTIIQDLSIKNTTSAAVNFNAAVNDSQVTLDKTFCTASAIRGTCKFVATIKASQTLGQQISSITINGQTLNYVLNVIPKVVPLPALSYSNPMDVGTTPGATISKSFQVINQSTSILAYVADISQTNSQFSITSNCPSVDRNRSCPINITFTPTTPLVAGIVNSTFKLNGITINVQATVTAPADLPKVTSPVNPWDFGDIEQGKSKTLSISINNTTGLSDSGPMIVSGLSNFSNPIITCSNSWVRARTCKITLTFNATAKSIQEYLETLTIKGTAIQLDLNLRANVISPSGVVACTLANSPSYGVNINNVATVSGNIPLCQVSACTDSNLYEVSPDQLSCMDKAIPCQLSDVQSNGWNTSNYLTITGNKTGSDVSQCVISTCSTNFSVNPSLKSCEADSCSLLNSASFGVNLLNVATVSGTTPNCVVASCSNSSLYDIAPDQKSCVDKPLSCTLVDAQSNGWNITNAQAPTGTKVGSNISQCAVSVCNSNFALNSATKSCDAISCTLANATGNGVTSILNVATVSGTTPNCSVTSCNANYKVAVDNKSCSPKLCNELNASELSALGYNLTGATISGTYNTCTLTCTSPLQQLSVDGKSCEDKTPAGTILFAQDYTKILTPNVLNITSTNGQSLQFYSDASCTTIAGAALSLPLASTNLTLSPGDGVKNVYAKILNGSKSSACLTDNIVLDQTLPALAVTTPALNANIAGNSLVISGTCLELNAPTVSVGITLNGVTQNVSCTSGLFSSTFNITAVPVGSQAISLSATDLAGNIGIASSTFNRINCTAFQTVSGNLCVDNIPTGTILFAADYTKVLSPNTVNITSSNAQQLQFYSNVGCTTTSGSPISLPTSTTTLTVSSGDGTKTAYAKFINGTASSACLSDTIILDQTNPVVSFSNPTGNPTILTTTTTVSGSCSDNLSGINGSLIVSIDSVASSSQNATCSGGLFSMTYTLPGTLVNGTQYTMRVVANDRATNQSSNTATFVKNIGRTLTFTKNGNGVTVSTPAGINCGSTCSGTFVNSSSILLSSTPSLGHKVSSWGGSCTSAGTSLSCNIASITANLSASVTFSAKTCTESMTAAELLAMGINTTNSPGTLTGTSYPSCLLASCNSGYYNAGTSCIQQICSPNSVQSCTLTNGTANQTCNAQGTALGSCTAQSCISGYFIENNACVPIYFNTASGVDTGLLKIARYDSQNLLLGGQMSTYKGTMAQRIVKINSGTGLIDPSFDSGTGFSITGGTGTNTGGTVYAMKVMPNGQVFVAGNFLYYDGTAVAHLVRLNSDGSLDTVFNTSWLNTTTSRSFVGSNSPGVPKIYDVQTQSDGKILLFGDFVYQQGTDSLAFYNRKTGVMRLNSDGTFDNTFSIPFSQQNATNSLTEMMYGEVARGIVLSSGKILVTTNMQLLSGSIFYGVFRLNSDGSRDTSFSFNNYQFATQTITQMELQTDGKILFTGGIVSVNGTERRGIARLNSDGTLDATFNAGFNTANGFSLAVQSNGKILFAGGGTNNLRRLNSDGSADSTFINYNYSGPVVTIVLNSDSTMFVGGNFTTFNSSVIYGLLKLTSTGAKTQ